MANSAKSGAFVQEFHSYKGRVENMASPCVQRVEGWPLFIFSWDTAFKNKESPKSGQGRVQNMFGGP